MKHICSSKMVWKVKNESGEVAVLYSGDEKICAVYKELGVWKINMYVFGWRAGRFLPTPKTNLSIEDAEETAVRLIWQECTDQIRYYDKIRRHLPD